MKMAFVTTYDAREVRAWSGIPSYMAQAFEQAGVDIRYVGPLAERFQSYYQGKQFAYRALGRRHFREHEPRVLDGFARQIASESAADPPDVVFSPGTIPIARVAGDQPVAFWSDATFAGLLDFYPEFSNLSRAAIANGHAVEREAIARADLCVYSSAWAAESAIADYGADPAKVRVVTYGANLSPLPTGAEVKRLIEGRSGKVCELLFLGVHWQRKGGAFAIEVARGVQRLGMPVRMTFVGAEPDEPPPDIVRSLGFIDKSSEEGRKRFQGLLGSSHLLVLPSVAECTPIAFSEANAYGVPCLARDVGGVSEVIRDGSNGLLFPASEPPRVWAQAIVDTVKPAGTYGELALCSRREYDRRLNWATATGQVLESCSALVERQRAGASRTGV